jgi:hypothetical protein
MWRMGQSSNDSKSGCLRQKKLNSHFYVKNVLRKKPFDHGHEDVRTFVNAPKNVSNGKLLLDVAALEGHQS